MKTITDAELATLAAIQGKFCESKAKRVESSCYALLCIVGGLAFFFVELFTDGMPSLPLTSDQWTAVFLSPSLIVLGLFIWIFNGCTYVFDGTSILQFTRFGRVMKKLEIQQITHIGAELGWLNLRTAQTRINVPLIPSLLSEIQNKAPKSTINDKEKQSLRRRGYLIIFLQLLAGGGMFAAMILLISLFYDGKAAQFLRLFSMFIFLGISFGGWLLVVGLSLLAVIIKNIWKTQ